MIMVFSNQEQQRALYHSLLSADIFALWFLSIFFFCLPNLSGHRLDVYHTSSHGVALV